MQYNFSFTYLDDEGKEKTEYFISELRLRELVGRLMQKGYDGPWTRKKYDHKKKAWEEY